MVDGSNLSFGALLGSFVSERLNEFITENNRKDLNIQWV